MASCAAVPAGIKDFQKSSRAVRIQEAWSSKPNIADIALMLAVNHATLSSAVIVYVVPEGTHSKETATVTRAAFLSNVHHSCDWPVNRTQASHTLGENRKCNDLDP